MKKRIILNESQVRAVLETGRVVVRKVVKPQPESETECPYHVGEGHNKIARVNPLGNVGDKVWVAETFCYCDSSSNDIGVYRAGPTPKCHLCEPWSSAAVMPQWASRITLEIKSVRIEHGDQWEWVYELKRLE
jgi:hypothetical protein